MSLNQTVAIFEDAYRELNAKKMFWVTLGLTVLVIAGFATLGVGDNGFRVLWFDVQGGNNVGFLTARQAGLLFYKWIFSTFVVGLWFTWLATILAIVSTAFIFPDFLGAGSIDLYLSKPISRLKLFLLKFASGLLFATLQVTLFCVGSFLVLGLRAGVWMPGLFLGIPIVVCFFSYLYAFSVFFGVWTRSTIAAILLTILVWVGLWGLHWLELGTLGVLDAQAHNTRTEQLARIDTQIEAVKGAEMEAATRQEILDELQKQRERIAARPENTGTGLKTAHDILYGAKTVLPKTAETTSLLDRILFEEEKDLVGAQGGGGGFGGRRNRGMPMMQAQKEMGQRSLWWIVGTSLGFEALVVGAAAWIFCRRDY